MTILDNNEIIIDRGRITQIIDSVIAFHPAAPGSILSTLEIFQSNFDIAEIELTDSCMKISIQYIKY